MSKACCTLPPVSAEYTPKGTYGTVGGLKAYTTGPEDAKSAVLVVYDVFGYSPQILQGADILASGGYRVVMPDFLHGDYCTADMFSGTPEGDAKKNAYFSKFPGIPNSQSEQIGKALAELKAKYPKVGTVGYCWGWKATVTAKDVNEFAAIASCHPSFIDLEDAERVNVPVALLPSQDEDKATVDAVHAALEKKNPGANFLKWYNNDVHGWCAARADLSGNEHTEAYQDAYKELLTFFRAKL